MAGEGTNDDKRADDRRPAALTALHDATREMMTAGDPEAVAERAVAALEETLDLPVATVWLTDDTGRRLEPVAATARARDLFDELPTYTADDESLSWRAYEAGESLTFDDIPDDGVANPDTPVRSELVFPLGEYGVVNIGSEEPDAFDKTDVRLAELLMTNATAALKRAEREQTLREQTERMELFNSILRHDVLNGMMVIDGKAELLTEELDDPPDDLTVIREWTNDVVDVVEDVRKVLGRLTGEGPDPYAVDLPEAVESELNRLERTYPSVEFEAELPDRLPVLADDLLPEVIGNVLINAVEHNESEDLRIRVSTEQTGGVIELHVADDGRGVPDERKDEVFRRESGRLAESVGGSGFGLFFVDSMLSSYGGRVRVEDNDPTGAVFIMEFRAADPQSGDRE